MVTYKADDWDDFQKDSGRFTGYNRMIAALGYFSSYDFEIMGEGVFNSGEIWLLSTSETAERTIGMTDTDKMLIQDAAYRPGKEVFYADELRIPDNIKVLGLGRSALSGMEINKLILPACEIQVRCYSSSDSTLNDAHIKELVIDGDIHLEHQMFQGNVYLESVTFNCDPDIDFSTFWDCPSLKNINISLDKDINGQAFYGCHQLMTINGESPIRDDGSIKPEYLDFIKRNFNNADGIGFIDKYTEYCVKKTVSETVTEDMPDIVKVKALHDKLCSMVSYDFDDIQALKNHVDSSVFLNETSVCEGYAKGLNLLLHEAGVPSCYVNTGEHAWVIVKVGNHYFHVDPTWDDGDEINYNWFMKSDSQFENKEFHSDWKLKLPSEMHRFQWETLPKCSDIMGDIDGNKNVDARDATAILTSYASASAGGKELADSVLADYNFDGIVDVRDASAVLAYYTGASV